MEIILHNDANNVIRKSTDNYCSTQIPTDMQVSVEHERKKCKHFTIRDYVSELRKRDANICIPFSSHNVHTSNTLSTKLPPLDVKKFRRWCCESCIHEVVTSETAVESQPMEGNKIISIKDTSIASTSDANQVVEKLPLHFQESTPTNTNGKVDVASPSSLLINKDFEVVSKNQSKESLNQVTKSNTSTGEREPGRLGVSTSGIALVIPDVSLKILSSSCERTTTKHPTSVTAKITQAQEIDKKTRRKQGCYIRNFRPRNTGKFCTLADIMERSMKCKDDKKHVRIENIVRHIDENPTGRLHPNEINESKSGGIPNSGGGSSLTLFIKRVRKKRSLHKEINSKVEGSLHTVNKRERHADGKKIAMLKSSISPRKDKPVQKGCNTVEELQRTFSQPKSTENTNNIGFASNKKNKRSSFEHGSTSKIRYTKDTLGAKKELRKKQRTTHTCNTNDIPMDIVELLAKKQQERHTTNLEVSTDDRIKLPESAENLKDGNEDTQNSNIKSKRYLEFDLNEAPACASTELQTPSPYTGLSMNGSHLSIVESNTYYSPLIFPGNQTIMNSSDNSQTNSNNTAPLMSLNQAVNNVGNSSYSANEPLSASNLLKIMQNSSNSLMQKDYVWSHNNQCYEHLGIRNGQGVNICKPLPRIGILGPQLQKEITNKFINFVPTLGYGTTNFNRSGFSFNELNTTSKSIIGDNAMNAKTAKSYDYSRVQPPTMSREGAFQPLKSTCKMEECLVNRNPAEDCDYVSQFPDSNVLKNNPPMCQRGQNGKRTRKVRQIKTVLNG